MHSNNVNKLFRLTAITNSVLFLIVIFAVSSISFSTVTDILYSELSVANRTILYQTMQNVDSQLKNIDMYISNLAKDRTINEYILNPAPDPIAKFDVSQIVADAKDKNAMISEIFIYSGETGKFIPFTSTKSPDFLYSVISSVLSEEKQAWIDVENTNGSLVFVKKLYNKKGVIAATVSETLLYEAISKYRTENKNGTFFVINRAGVVLSHSNKAYIGTNVATEKYTQYILSEKSSDKPYETMYMNQKTLMFTGRSGYTGWAYTSAIPVSMFMTPINKGKIQIYLLSSLIFLISVTLAYILVKKMYKPVDKFVHSVATSITKNHSPEQIRQNFARHEKIAAALGHIDIPDRLPLDAAAHERAEKIPVRERVARKIYGAHGGDGAVVPGQPAAVQIVRQIAADLALGQLRAAEKADLLPAQQLLRQHLLALREKARYRRDIARLRRRHALVELCQQDLVVLILRHAGDLFAFVHAVPSVPLPF